MALDLAKYRTLFLEEGSEHLSEISSALLALEKDASAVDSIDVIFRMAHSIKSMAASLGYDAITELSHALEDRMEALRSAGRVESGEVLAQLFRGLEGLEQMTAAVRESDEPPAPRPELVAMLRQAGADGDSTEAAGSGPKKKDPR